VAGGGAERSLPDPQRKRPREQHGAFRCVDYISFTFILFKPLRISRAS
jgi:hypothetical protein